MVENLRSPRPSRQTGTTLSSGSGSIRDDETLTWAEACRRLNWGPRLAPELLRRGLRAVLVGRAKITTGAWIREFVEKLANSPGNRE